MEIFELDLYMNPFLASAIKFAVLGSLGELVAKLIGKKEITIGITLYSMLVWATLGVIIKFMFTGMHGFVDALILKGYLPEGRLLRAFFISFFTNAMFGPWVIILHRLFDNFFFRKFSVPTNGLKGAMMTLLWFWIPAHTLTFSLQNHDWQITLAALWGFVLGLILGFFKNRKKK